MNDNTDPVGDVSMGEIPTLRIGFTTEKDTIELEIDGKFSLFDHAGIALVKDVHASSSWYLHSRIYMTTLASSFLA